MTKYKVTAGEAVLRVYMADNLVVEHCQLLPLMEVSWQYVLRRAGRRPHRAPRMMVMNGLRWAGARYWRGTAWPKERRCMVRIGKLHEHPQEGTYDKFENMPVVWHANWRECFLGLTTHELWHLFCKQPRGRPQEFECETVEAEAIEFYRKKHGITFVPPVEGVGCINSNVPPAPER